MTPEREAALFAKLDLLLELYRRMEADIREVKADQRALDARSRDDFRDLRKSVGDVGDRVVRVEGRIEEQSKFLQLALASRQPRKPAA